LRVGKNIGRVIDNIGTITDGDGLKNEEEQGSMKAFPRRNAGRGLPKTALKGESTNNYLSKILILQRGGILNCWRGKSRLRVCGSSSTREKGDRKEEDYPTSWGDWISQVNRRKCLS